jgi:hypothetical protein
MLEKELRRYYLNVYRLAQNAAEAFTLFAVIQTWFKKTGWTEDFDNALVNEDLLRIIAHCSRRTAIVATHILCDNGAEGTCNVFKLVERLGDKGIDTKSMRQRLRLVREPIQKIRLLRNYNDAHLKEKEEWKTGFGELKARDVNKLLSVIFSVVIDCGNDLDIPKMPFEQIYKGTVAHAERLIRALSEQVKAGRVGVRFQSVREWEEERHLQSEEDWEDGNYSQDSDQEP